MKKHELRVDSDADSQPEYDFSAGVRGKYAERYAAASNVVVLAPDVAEILRDSESVNQALRVLAKLVRQHTSAVEAGRC